MQPQVLSTHRFSSSIALRFVSLSTRCEREFRFSETRPRARGVESFLLHGRHPGCINILENSAPTNCVRSIGVFPVSRLLRLDRSSIPSDTLAWTLSPGWCSRMSE